MLLMILIKYKLKLQLLNWEQAQAQQAQLMKLIMDQLPLEMELIRKEWATLNQQNYFIKNALKQKMNLMMQNSGPRVSTELSMITA